MRTDDDLGELVRALAGLDQPAMWNQAAELGLMSIGIPEDAGGSGGTLSDLLVVVEQFASSGVSTPVIEVSTARWILAQCGRDVGKADFPTIVSCPGRWPADPGPCSIAAVPWSRSCDRIVVVDDAGAVFEIVASETEVEPDSNLAGEQRDRLTVHAGAAVTSVGAVSAACVRVRLGLLWSAAILGAAKGAYRLTKEHVRIRQQFGAALIGIPAVTSQLAIMKTDILQIQTAFDRAASMVERAESPPDRLLAAVAVSRIIASACAGDVARLAHQLHGAIGTTKEHQLQRYTRRLWAWRDGDDSTREWERSAGAEGTKRRAANLE